MARSLYVVVGLVFAAALYSYSTSLSMFGRASPEMAANREAMQSLRQRLAEAEDRANKAETARTAAETAMARQLSPEQRQQPQHQPRQLQQPQPFDAGSAVDATTTYVHTLSSLPAKPGDLMMMTYATGGVREMLHNWVLHVQRLGLPILVSAMDKDVVQMAVALKFHCLDWSHTAAGYDSSYVRGSFDGFRALGVRKLDALLPVLRAGINVVLSDVDCVWSSSPLPMFHGQLRGYEDFAAADVLLATDCMAPDLDAPASGSNGVPGCYRDTVDKNTGVIAVRATPNGIATMAEWKVRLQVGEKDEQDQTTFNDLLDGNGRGHRWGMNWQQRSAFHQFADTWCGRPKAMRGYNRLWEGGDDEATGGRGDASVVTKLAHTAGSRRIFDVCLPNVTRHAHVGIFPITEVAGGHTFFVQQLQSPTAKWPMAVHATYQFGDMPDYPFGKRQRFRDWGMWLVDNDDELITSSRYLVLEDDAPLLPRAKWEGYSGDLHVRGRQHVDHLDRTRQRLAHGFALARALNRTVVLPTLWCYCDKFWHRLDRCAIPSATGSQPLPFVCPLDHVIDPSFLHGTSRARMSRPRRGMLASRVDGPWEDGLPFRGRYWLRQLGAHPRIGLSVATLGIAGRKGAGGGGGGAGGGAEGGRTATGQVAAPIEASPMELLPELLSATRTRSASDAGAGAVDVAARALPAQHDFVPGRDGPYVRLPAGRTDQQLRSALAAYDHVKLLRVSLTEADELLSCYERPKDAADMRALASYVFAHEWCYRPHEMTAEWLAVERKGKPVRKTEPWCVWGFATPQVPTECPA